MKVLQIAQGHTAAEPGLGLHPLLSHNKASTVYDGVSGSPRQGPKNRIPFLSGFLVYMSTGWE